MSDFGIRRLHVLERCACTLHVFIYDKQTKIIHRHSKQIVINSLTAVDLTENLSRLPVEG